MMEWLDSLLPWVIVPALGIALMSFVETIAAGQAFTAAVDEIVRAPAQVRLGADEFEALRLADLVSHHRSQLQSHQPETDRAKGRDDAPVRRLEAEIVGGER